MSDDRKIELTLDEIVLRPVELRARADACSSSRSAASRLLNLIADKVDALPKPRMAEPTEFGAKVSASWARLHPEDRDVFLRVYGGSGAVWYSRQHGWAAWDDLIDPEPLP